MKDDRGKSLGVGSAFEFEGVIDEAATDIALGEDQVLFEGEYMIYVPPGQKATVVYTLAIHNEEENSS